MVTSKLILFQTDPIVIFHAVFHEDEVDRRSSFELYLVDAIDSGNETVFIFLQIFDVVIKILYQCFKVLRENSFDDEEPIV